MVHILLEHEGGTVAERSAKDVETVIKMIKEVMKLNVTVTGSFRAGKKLANKPGLLIVTLANPSSRGDILRCAP